MPPRGMLPVQPSYPVVELRNTSQRSPRVFEAPNAEMCGLDYLRPKDVILESMDLSDRVRIRIRCPMDAAERMGT